MDIVHFGFTGTRKGMTEAQKSKFRGFVNHWTDPDIRYYFHHGDCIGADADAHRIVKSKVPHVNIITHPSTHKDRAFCQGAVQEYRVKSPMQRNDDIVNACQWLIACPSGPERQRSGTWATVRRFRKKNHNQDEGEELYIIYPDGSIGEE